MSGIENVIFERGRQLGKGWNDQSNLNENSELALCASHIVEDYLEESQRGQGIRDAWPVERATYVREKYGADYVCRLRIAAALIVAEIDRIQLLALQPTDSKE